jgi:hypothetical protein
MPSQRVLIKGSGIRGPKGDRGLPGDSAGGSLPNGGTTGQALVKLSNADQDAGWSAGSGDPSALTHAAASKATLVDADAVPIVDSATGNSLKQGLMSSVWAYVQAKMNAAGVAKLATARNINGVAFNGTADITIANNAPTYIWRYTGGAYPALPGTKPTGTVLVTALGPVSPADAGATIPAWIVPGTCDLLYQVTPS